jgi:hypothetical protein
MLASLKWKTFADVNSYAIFLTILILAEEDTSRTQQIR